MKKFLLMIILFALLASAVPVLPMAVQEENTDFAPERARTTLVVDGTTYATVNDALVSAQDGDIIRVYEGAWPAFSVSKSGITIIGNHSSNTTIDGGMGADVVYIGTSSWVNITGLKFINSGSVGHGVNIQSSWHCRIWDCESIGNQGSGIYAYNASYLTLTNVTTKNNTNANIDLRGGDYQKVENSQILGSTLSHGLYMTWSSSWCTAANNTMFGNWGAGLSIDSNSHNISAFNNTFEQNVQGAETIATKDCFIYNNNFINNNGVGSFDFSTAVYKPYPVGGNYWDDIPFPGDSLMGAAQNVAGSDGMNDTSYDTGDGPPDLYPWIYQDGWLNQINFQPVMVTPTIPDATQDQPFQYTFSANDGNFDALWWGMMTNATWLNVGGWNGTIWGTPGNSDVGTFYVDIQVMDNRTGSDSFNSTFTVANVNDPPVITGTDVTTTNEGELYEVFYTGSDPDPTGDTLVWSFSTNASWLSWDNATERMHGTPASTDIGPYLVDLGLNDSIDGEVHRKFTLTVLNVNDAPVIDPPSALVATEDVLFSYQFTAEDLDGDALTWSLVSPYTFLTITPDGNLSGTPDNAHVGTFDINVSVDDGNFGTDWANLLFEVLNTNDPPVFTNLGSSDEYDAYEDSEFLIGFEAFDADPTGDQVVFEMWTNAGFLIIDDATGNVTGTPDNWDVGVYWVNVTVKDGFGIGDFFNFTLTVHNVNDPPLPIEFGDTLYEEYYNISEPIEFSANSVDVDGDELNYTWDFGDGTVGYGADTTHIYSRYGTYTVTLTVTDPSGGTTTSSHNVSVTGGSETQSETVTIVGGTVELVAHISGGGKLKFSALSEEQIETLTDGDTEGLVGYFLDITLDGGELESLEITIYYGTLPEGVVPEDLAIYYWNEETSEWTKAEETGVDTENKTVWAKVTHLTVFAAKTDQSVDPSGGGGSGGGGVSAMAIIIMIIIVVAVLFIIIIVVVVAVVVKRGKGKDDGGDVSPPGEGEDKAGEDKPLPPPPPEEDDEQDDPSAQGPPGDAGELPPPPDDDEEPESEDDLEQELESDMDWEEDDWDEDDMFENAPPAPKLEKDIDEEFDSDWDEEGGDDRGPGDDMDWE